MIEYTLIRSQRKSLSIRVTADATLEARAPMKMPLSHIEEFIASKESWIREKLAQTQELARQRREAALSYDTPVKLRGRFHPIVATDEPEPYFDGESFYIPRGLPPDYLSSAIVGLYKQIAKFHITQRVAHFAPLVGKTPDEIHITGSTSRWGSCSSYNRLYFSWFLIMADEEAIDYVIVHELAHLFEMNHSERFWAIVARFFPNYRELRGRLRDLSREQAVNIR
jgi:predicted metal-dependent hydrolase